MKTATRILINTLVLTANTNLVSRKGPHGTEIELHSPDGVFALDSAILTQLKEFGGNGKAPARRTTTVTIPEKSKVVAGAKQTGKVIDPTEAKKAAPATKAARRYTPDQQKAIIAGYTSASSKGAFCRANDVSVDTVRRWMKDAEKTQ